MTDNNNPTATCFIGRIRRLWQEDGYMFVEVKWYYRPSETRVACKPSDPKEIYASRISNATKLKNVIGKCSVFPYHDLTLEQLELLKTPHVYYWKCWYDEEKEIVRTGTPPDNWFIAEKILGKRVSEDGITEYLIRWAGYTRDHDSWVREVSKILLATYDEQREKEKEEIRKMKKSKVVEVADQIGQLVSLSKEQSSSTEEDIVFRVDTNDTFSFL